MKHDYEVTEDDVRRWAKYILESHNMPLTKENIENLTETIIRTEWEAQTFIVNNVLNIFKKTYQNVYAETYDKNNHYDVIIYCPHAKNRESIKKIKILNKHLLIGIGEREYRYGVVVEDGEKYYVIPGLICTIYLPLSNDMKNILRYSVKNGLIHVEISKNKWFVAFIYFFCNLLV